MRRILQGEEVGTVFAARESHLRVRKSWLAFGKRLQGDLVVDAGCVKALEGGSSLLAAGITVVFAIQIFVNIGVVTGAFPTTGQALPFISAGGSSMVIFLAAMGVLLNISRSTEGSMQPVVRAAFRRRPSAVSE